jgi:hypothetical protein
VYNPLIQKVPLGAAGAKTAAVVGSSTGARSSTSSDDVAIAAAASTTATGAADSQDSIQQTTFWSGPGYYFKPGFGGHYYTAPQVPCPPPRQQPCSSRYGCSAPRPSPRPAPRPTPVNPCPGRYGCPRPTPAPTPRPLPCLPPGYVPKPLPPCKGYGCPKASPLPPPCAQPSPPPPPPPQPDPIRYCYRCPPGFYSPGGNPLTSFCRRCPEGSRSTFIRDTCCKCMLRCGGLIRIRICHSQRSCYSWKFS